MELLVRVQDKINEDFYLNCGCTKRGDVIVAQPDGHDWSWLERTLPEYRILQIPDMDEATASTFVSPEIPTSRIPPKTLQKRAFKLDIDSLPIADYLNDDTRAAPALIIQNLSSDNVQTSQSARATADAVTADVAVDAIPTVEYAITDFLALKVAKPPVQDLAVFGSPPTEF